MTINTRLLKKICLHLLNFFFGEIFHRGPNGLFLCFSLREQVFLEGLAEEVFVIIFRIGRSAVDPRVKV